MRKFVRWLLFALVCLAALGIWRERHGAIYWPFRNIAPIASSAEAGEGNVLLVNAWNPLPEDYQPGTLVNLYEQRHSFLLASSEIWLEKSTYEAAEAMFHQAEEDGVNGFIITSGYRTRAEQEEIYAQTTDGTAALPGTSEHETGLAFDVTAQRDGGGFEETPQFDWLIENCGISASSCAILRRMRKLRALRTSRGTTAMWACRPRGKSAIRAARWKNMWGDEPRRARVPALC